MGLKFMGRVLPLLPSVSVKKKNAKASFALKFTPNFLLLFGQGRREGQGKWILQETGQRWRSKRQEGLLSAEFLKLWVVTA